MSKRGASTSPSSCATSYNTRHTRKRREKDHITIGNVDSNNEANNEAKVAAAPIPAPIDTKTTANTGSSAIEEQKERAKKFWRESNYDEEMKGMIHDDVMDKLDQGLVLPIFHTLCRHPYKRLFLPNTRVGKDDKYCSDVIHLSSASVTIGECKEETGVVCKISSKKERSYLPAFFNEDVATFEVEDMSFSWEFDEDFTEMVTDLVNARAQIVGEDVEVTKLIRPFDVDSINGNNLITRSLSRGVVADCLEKSERCTTYAVTGSPGIGKSWTLIYALQQALLYENACVLFCFQKQGIAIVCIRRNNAIYVWKNRNELWKQECLSNLFDNSNVLVLLDPKESKKGGAEHSEGLRMLIMAASNNVNHFASSSKTTPMMDRILSVYTEKELEVSIPYMMENQKLPAEIKKMLQRSKIVGPLPRYIVSKRSFVSRERETRGAIDKLDNDEIREILSFNGLNQNDGTVPECIFSVNVRLTSNIQLDAATTDKQLGQYKMVSEDYYNECKMNNSVGYDGQCISDYWQREITVMSEAVLTAISQSSRKNILSFWGMHEEGLSQMGHIVENLFWHDLQNKYSMNIFPLKNQAVEEEPTLCISECEYIENAKIEELSKKVFFVQSSIVSRMHQNSPLVDFAGPNLQVYQVTVSKKHSMSINGLRGLFLSSGHCEKKRDGTIVKSKNADSKGQIKFYWVVPPGRATAWKNKNCKTISSANQPLKECLDEYVDQYILVMDIDPTK